MQGQAGTCMRLRGRELPSEGARCGAAGQLIEMRRLLCAFALGAALPFFIGYPFTLWFHLLQVLFLLGAVCIIRALACGRLKDWVVDLMAVAISVMGAVGVQSHRAHESTSNAIADAIQLTALFTVPAAVLTFGAVVWRRHVIAKRGEAG